MAKKIQHISTIKYNYKDKGPNYSINMEIDLKRFEKQYSRAQYQLDSMVFTSMMPYMPMETGTFMKVTQAMSQAIAGSGKVVAAAPPMGRYLYEGVVMVGERTRSAWAEKGEKKVATGIPIDYTKNKHPKAQSHWFEAAKLEYGDKWIAKVKQIAGGGSK